MIRGVGSTIINRTSVPRTRWDDPVGQLEHMFKEKEGHLPNTKENQAIILKMVNNKENYIGNSKIKYTELERYTQILDNGNQLWANVRNRRVENCGINKEAGMFDKETGLYRNTPQKKK